MDTCFAAIGRDSLNSSRPISSAAESPTQIAEMFDTVSYDKVDKKANTHTHSHLFHITLLLSTVFTSREGVRMSV